MMRSQTFALVVVFLLSNGRLFGDVGGPTDTSQWVAPREHVEFHAAKSQDGLTLILPIGSSSESVRVTHVAWSPDGKYIASFGVGENARLWDARTGRLVRIVPSDKLAFHPKGGTVSYSGNDLHDTLTGRRVRRWPLIIPCGEPPDGVIDRLSSSIPGVTFSKNGRWLATYDGTEGCVRISDVKAGRQTLNLYAHNHAVNTAAFSADGRLLATGSAEVKVWDVSTGALFKTLESNPSVEAVTFSPDGKTLASGDAAAYGKPGTAHLKLWDTATWAPRASFADVWPEGLAYSPDGALLVVATLGKGAEIRDGFTGALLRTLHGFRESAWAVAFSPNGKRVAGASMDGTVTIWDVGTGRILAAMLTLPPAVMKPKDPSAGLVQEPGNAPSVMRTLPRSDVRSAPDPQQREWVVFTPEGYYDGSPDAEAFMQWEGAKGREPGAEHRKRFRQPGQVAEALRAG